MFAGTLSVMKRENPLECVLNSVIKQANGNSVGFLF